MQLSSKSDTNCYQIKNSEIMAVMNYDRKFANSIFITLTWSVRVAICKFMFSILSSLFNCIIFLKEIAFKPIYFYLKIGINFSLNKNSKIIFLNTTNSLFRHLKTLGKNTKISSD